MGLKVAVRQRFALLRRTRAARRRCPSSPVAS